MFFMNHYQSIHGLNFFRCLEFDGKMACWKQSSICGHPHASKGITSHGLARNIEGMSFCLPDWKESGCVTVVVASWTSRFCVDIFTKMAIFSDDSLFKLTIFNYQTMKLHSWLIAVQFQCAGGGEYNIFPSPLQAPRTADPIGPLFILTPNKFQKTELQTMFKLSLRKLLDYKSLPECLRLTRFFTTPFRQGAEQVLSGCTGRIRSTWRKVSWPIHLERKQNSRHCCWEDLRRITSANETIWDPTALESWKFPLQFAAIFFRYIQRVTIPISTWTVAFADGFKSKALSHRGAMESLNLFWVSPCPKRNDSCLDHRSSFAPFPNNLALHFFRCCSIILESSEVSWNCCQTGMIDEPFLKHYGITVAELLTRI